MRVDRSPIAELCRGGWNFALVALLLVCLAALLLRVGLAVAFPNLIHGDETFQTVEQAHRLVYGTGMTPWEFVEGARSWLLPGILAGAMQVGEVLFGSDGGHRLGVLLLLSLLSLAPVVCAFFWAYLEQRSIQAGVLAGLACGVWFELVYFGPKSLSDAVGAHTLILGAFLLRRDAAIPRRFWLLLAGVTIGLATMIRPHLVPATLLIMLWNNRWEWRERWLPSFLGAALSLLAAGALDWVTWGAPFHSYWTYLRVNILEGKAASFGTVPWYYYFVWMIQTWSWGLPLVASLVLLGARKQPLLLLVAAVVVLSHSPIGHKEYRFIYPALTFAMVAAGIGLAEAGRMLNHALLARPSWTLPALLLLLWIGTSLACATTTSFSKYWRARAGFVSAFHELSRSNDLCGVSLWGIKWPETAGYTYLRRDVPVFVSFRGEEFARLSPATNYALAFADAPPPDDAFIRMQCWASGWVDWGEVCLYKRPGACSSESAVGERRVGSAQPWR